MEMTEKEHQNLSNRRKQQKQLNQSEEMGIRILKQMMKRQQLRDMNFNKEKKEKEQKHLDRTLQKRKSRLGSNMRHQTKSGVLALFLWFSVSLMKLVKTELVNAAPKYGVDHIRTEMNLDERKELVSGETVFKLRKRDYDLLWNFKEEINGLSVALRQEKRTVVTTEQVPDNMLYKLMDYTVHVYNKKICIANSGS